MAIRLGNCCKNCRKLINDTQCGAHFIHVETHYTCDSFEIRPSLKNQRNCSNCNHFKHPACANSMKSAPGMLCSYWVPANRSA